MSDTQVTSEPAKPKSFTQEDAKKAIPKLTLPLNRLKRADTSLLNFKCDIPAGHPITCLTDPMYWSNEARRLKLHGRIDAIAEDGSFDVDLRVIALGHNWAAMRILRKWERPEGAVEEDPTPLEARLNVEHYGGGKWRVKSDDGKVIASGFTSKQDAVKARDEQLARMKAK